MRLEGAGQHAAMVHHELIQEQEPDEQDEELREAQEGTGYGEDEGEREDALETDDRAEPARR